MLRCHTPVDAIPTLARVPYRTLYLPLSETISVHHTFFFLHHPLPGSIPPPENPNLLPPFTLRILSKPPISRSSSYLRRKSYPKPSGMACPLHAAVVSGTGPPLMHNKPPRAVRPEMTSLVTIINGECEAGATPQTVR